MMDEPEPGFRSWDKEAVAQPTTPIADEVAGYDMLYSSGTTGRPKGIKRDFEGNRIDVPNAFLKILCADMCGMSADSIYLSPAPLYHAAPLRFNMMATILGGTSVIMEHFDAEEFLKLVEKYKATQSQLVPTMFVRMLKLPEEVRTRYDVSTLKGAIHAAAPCPVDVKAKMIEWWGPILIEYYAGSEGNGVTVSTSQQWLTHRGTVGRAVVGKVKILDENDEERPVGEIGTVYFADAPVFSYHNDPDKTKRAYNAKGWSTLGDVGYLDAEGFLYLTDRKSYMIISGGVNIYPQETEDVLITHPDVADVAVFGVPNEEMGEEVKAVVQPHDMAKAGKALENELIAVLPQASVADQMPEEHRLRGRAAAHADRQAGEAPSARQLLAEDGGEGVGPQVVRGQRRSDAVPTFDALVQSWWARSALPAPRDCVMPGLVPGIHVFTVSRTKDVDGRDSPAMTRKIMTSLPDLPLPSSIRSRYVDGINGLRMHVLEAGFETKGRPCLLLLHGFPELAYSWRKVMPALAEAGYHVIAPDQRGYGRTTGWDPDYDGDLALVPPAQSGARCARAGACLRLSLRRCRDRA